MRMPREIALSQGPLEIYDETVVREASRRLVAHASRLRPSHDRHRTSLPVGALRAKPEENYHLLAN